MVENFQNLEKFLDAFVSRPKSWEYAGISAEFKQYGNKVIVKATKLGRETDALTGQMIALLNPQVKDYTLNGYELEFVHYKKFQERKYAA
jgi:hypothetical protein